MENKLVHMHDIVSKAQAVAKDNMLVRYGYTTDSHHVITQ